MTKIFVKFVLTFFIPFLAAALAQEADGLSEPPSKLLVGHQSPILSAVFSPRGELIASGGGGSAKVGDNSIRIWDASTSGQLKKLEGHTSKIFSLAFSPDEKFLASASEDGTVKIWDVNRGVEVKRLIGHNGIVYSIVFSLDGKTLASGSADKTVKLWELASGSEIGRFVGHSSDVFSVAFSPLEDSIASGSQDRTIRIWNLKSGKEIRRYSGYGDNVWSVAYSPDGQFVAGASWDGNIRIWDVFENREVRAFRDLGLFAPLSVKFNRDGRLIAVGLSDAKPGGHTVKIWKTSDGKEVASFDSRPNSSIEFSPDGKRLVAGALDGSVKLWETKAEPPSLTSPADNDLIDGKVVNFQWMASPSALYYDLQVSQNRDFTEVINLQRFLIKENLSYEAPLNQRLWWRVRSGGFGIFGVWSTPRSFTLGASDESSCVVKIQIPKPKISLGDPITVNVVAESVKNLAGFQLELLFNPKILQVKEVEKGKLLQIDGGNIFWNKPIVDNQRGAISSIVASRLNPGGVSGSGAIVSIIFYSTSAGESEFFMKELKLSSPQGTSIPCIEAQGSMVIVESAIPPWDINRDGVVDVFDFVLVGQFLDQKAPEGLGFNPDVNRDGIVDILDFVLVGSHFGERYQLKAPPIENDQSQYSQHIPLLSNILKKMQTVQNIADSEGFERTKRILSQIISEHNLQNKPKNRPKSNELLQNYPNPFNPETWIPYQLAQDADVKIYIYDLFGRTVRKMDLGFKAGGFYVSPGMAAHFDGRDDRGEPVSSGLYFYSIQSGKFKATRKMVIVK